MARCRAGNSESDPGSLRGRPHGESDRAPGLRARSVTVLAHQGRPLEILCEVLARPEFADAEYFSVSGQLGHISGVAAVQRALREVDGTFDAVASLGGECFLVYLLLDGRITQVLEHAARNHVTPA